MEAGFNVLAAEPYVLVSKYTALRGYCQSIYFHEFCYNISRKLRLFLALNVVLAVVQWQKSIFLLKN